MNFNDPQELASLLEAWLLALGRPLLKVMFRPGIWPWSARDTLGTDMF